MADLSMELKIFDNIPDRFLDANADELTSVFSGPAFIHIAGKENPPLFLSTLLHGNETTGIAAIQELLKKYLENGKGLPRSLSLFLGNLHAARQNARLLPGQPDYNRIWSGKHFKEEKLPEHKMAKQVIQTAKRFGLFASIDVHNTSGKNPHFACVNKLDGSFINLGGLFSRKLVYFTRPREVLSRAFSKFGPSVSIESGQPDDPYGVPHVLDYLDRCLNLPSIPETLNDKEEFEIFHSVARIEVPLNSRIGFHSKCENVDFCFSENLDQLNFLELPENKLLGRRFNSNLKLSIKDKNGNEVGKSFIRYDGDEIRLTRPAIPSLFTTNENIVYQDCLGYLMQRYALS